MNNKQNLWKYKHKCNFQQYNNQYKFKNLHVKYYKCNLKIILIMFKFYNENNY